MRTLLAVDGSSASQDAIDEIARRPWPQASTVRVISAVHPYVPPSTEFVAAAITSQEIMQQHENQAKQVADEAADHIRKSGLSVETMVRQGIPEQ